MFDCDRNNLRKIRAHKIGQDEVEQALRDAPLAVYEQQMGSEIRFVYCGETDAGRLLAVVATAQFRVRNSVASSDGRLLTRAARNFLPEPQP